MQVEAVVVVVHILMVLQVLVLLVDVHTEVEELLQHQVAEEVHQNITLLVLVL